ncbi:ribonuclease T2 family protein [Hyphomicrobium sulfonivorans]|uniref:ribonuclease T2 family protein n=1 Tax=Hyphomicrobium sulfonivorans TaxID=121290 RepID=UPI00156D45C2|nr:ribonuclease T [Hyphomicrobium sulfonivorans]MBI1649746.1 ribonuclease T [Hyphomicrobium sulfonivorans]NSL71662.1 ribonuclease T [Hyphomicrobium sulfonivorans]
MKNKSIPSIIVIVLCALAVLVLRNIDAPNAQEQHGRSSSSWPSNASKPKGPGGMAPPNTAGAFDYYTMVMSWSPTHCSNAQEGRDDEQCARIDGHRHGFVLHGVWPQYERGYPEACRLPGRRRPFVPNEVINDMLDIMPSRGLVIHEYRTHGTCSGLDPAAYYALSRRLFNVVKIPDRFRNPFEAQFMSPEDVEAEFVRANNWLRPEMISVGCSGFGNRLRDVRICFTRNGQGRACGDNEAQNKMCRARQVNVPPVRSSPRRANTDSTPNMKPERDRGLPRPKILDWRD